MVGRMREIQKAMVIAHYLGRDLFCVPLSAKILMTGCPPWHRMTISCMTSGAAAHFAVASKSALSWGSGASIMRKIASSSLGVPASSLMYESPLAAMRCRTFTSQGMAPGTARLLSTNCMRSRICKINARVWKFSYSLSRFS